MLPEATGAEVSDDLAPQRPAATAFLESRISDAPHHFQPIRVNGRSQGH